MNACVKYNISDEPIKLIFYYACAPMHELQLSCSEDFSNIEYRRNRPLADPHIFYLNYDIQNVTKLMEQDNYNPLVLPHFEIQCITTPRLELIFDPICVEKNKIYKQPLYFPEDLCKMVSDLVNQISMEQCFDELKIETFINGKNILMEWNMTIKHLELGKCFEDHEKRFKGKQKIMEGFFLRETENTLNITEKHKDSSDYTIQICISLDKGDSEQDGGIEFTLENGNTHFIPHVVSQLVIWRGHISHEIISMNKEKGNGAFRLSFITFLSALNENMNENCISGEN